jgi:hypothetical protein
MNKGIENLKEERNAAIEAGDRFYFSGKPCRHHHMSVRYASTGACKECFSSAAIKSKSDPFRGQCYVDPERRSQRGFLKALRSANPLYSQVHAAKHRCKRLDLPFDLTPESVFALYEIDPICPITLKRMLLPTESGHRLDRLSMDRKDPTGGYTMDNIQLMSMRGNLIKGNNTDPTLFERMANLVRLHKKSQD